MIRKAVPDDTDQIFVIYRETSLERDRLQEPNYIAKTQQDGFHIGTKTKENLKKRITTSKIFNVFERDNKVVGYIDINREIYFPEKAKNIIWFDGQLKKKYFHAKTSIALHSIGVLRRYTGKGIARNLLNSAIKKLSQGGFKDLFAVITMGPLTNCSSIVFHSKLRFKRACVTMPKDMFGLKNYQSLLFHRKI